MIYAYILRSQEARSLGEAWSLGLRMSRTEVTIYIGVVAHY